MTTAQDVKMWRVKTGATTSVRLPVLTLGQLLIDHPEVEADLEQALGYALCAVSKDLARHGLYEGGGSGNTPIRRRKAPDLSGASA